MLHAPVPIVALVGYHSLDCSMYSIITVDTDVARDLPIFDVNSAGIE
jgi:hypothetical protein